MPSSLECVQYPRTQDCSKCGVIFNQQHERHWLCRECSPECRFGFNCTRGNYCIYNHPPTPKFRYASSDEGSDSDSSFDNRKRQRLSGGSSRSSNSFTFEFASPPVKKHRVTCSIHVEQLHYTSKEKLYVNVIFSGKRDNREVFEVEEKRHKYLNAIEEALRNCESFNKATRESKEIHVENMVHGDTGGKKYFSGHMERFDKDSEKKVKCFTFHINVTDDDDFKYKEASVREAAEYVDILRLESKIKAKDDEIKNLRDYIVEMESMFQRRA